MHRFDLPAVSTRAMFAHTGGAMHLDEAVKAEIKSLEDFKAFWLEKHKTDPGDWPLELPEGEWFEQYLAWMEMDGR